MNKRFLAFCLLYLLLAIVVLRVYSVYGVGWDFIAHYISGKAIFTGGFFNAVKEAAATNATNVNFGIVETTSVYFELYRAPLSVLIFGVMAPFLGSYSLEAYLLIMVVLLFYATAYFARVFDIDYLLLGSLIVLPYLVIFPFTINSEEMLSLSLTIMSLALVRKSKWQSGILLGLACLSKYTALIFLPVLLFGGDKKKILYGYLAFVLIILPWLVFNYAAFGNPIYSYISSIKVSLESSPQSFPSLISLGIITANFVPAIILLLVLFFNGRFRHGPRFFKDFKSMLKHERASYMILGAFILLAVVEFIILGFHEDTFDQTRYGYFLFASFGLLLAGVIGTEIRYKKPRLSYRIDPAYLLFAFSLISMFALLGLTGSRYVGLSSGSTNPIFLDSVGAVRELNLSGCNFISNDWVYLRYYNISAFSPFNYNETTSGYPAIIFFNNLGPSSTAVKIYNTEINYSYRNFSIYVPASCIGCCN